MGRKLLEKLKPRDVPFHSPGDYILIIYFVYEDECRVMTFKNRIIIPFAQWPKQELWDLNWLVFIGQAHVGTYSDSRKKIFT